ncbi:Hypothetical protein, putative [Bodo saltans]|uniref:FHA domain-containing protein n=1 Tax=Bodo saltans TaxID=75058 RepID=A0A0S4JDA4_BODSA|nr:Hypothetical protein, putative [Bodo saltans]|eukprot:CUG88074.1 Hypothetical protein, putative [Bodo saltans]
MWVLYFQGKSSYWLTGSRTYTIGRRDNDIVIVDDASISRVHVTIEIGASVVERLDCSTPRLPVAMMSSSSQCSAPSQQQRQHSSQRIPQQPVLLTRPFLRLTDTSKYGSSVLLSSTSTTTKQQGNGPTALKASETFVVPSDIMSFELNLGTHGMSFHVVYEPFRICASNIQEMAMPSLEATIARLGFHLVSDPMHCDLLMTDALEPTQDLVVALCGAKPIVLPAYMDAVLARKGCKVPLPDPADKRFLPPLDPFWCQLGGLDHNIKKSSVSTYTNITDEAEEALHQLFLPKKERRYLFVDMAFVCIQQSLYDEVAQYLAAARGRAVFDDALWDALGTSRHPSEAKSKLQAFCLRHQHHILLYTTADRLPAPLEALQQLFSTKGCFGVTLVEYSALLRCILLIQRMVIPTVTPPPVQEEVVRGAPRIADDAHHENVNQNGIGMRSDTAMTRATTVATMATSPEQREDDVSGRRTGKLLFDDEGLDDGVANGNAVTAIPWNAPNEGGWRNGLGGASFVPPAEAADVALNGRTEGQKAEERVPIQHKLRLPSYPCFVSYTKTSAKAAHPQIGASGKLFQKQPLTVSSRYAEFEAVRPTTAAAEALTSRIARVDAINMFDDEVTDLVGRENRFNAFDTAEQHTTHRRRTTAAAAKKAPSAASKKSSKTLVGSSSVGVVAPAAPHVVIGDDDDVRQIESQPVARSGRGGGGAIDIFAVDALF